MKDAKLTPVRSRPFGTLVIMVGDVLLIALACALSMLLLYEGEAWGHLCRDPISLIAAVLIIWIFFECALLAMHSHNIIWRYAGYREYMNFAASAGCSVLLGEIVLLLVPALAPLPLNVAAVCMLLVLMLTGGVRLVLRFMRLVKISRSGATRNSLGGKIMIVGAGSVGYMLIHSLGRSSMLSGDKVVCVIDDDKSKQGKLFYGVPVVGGREAIEAAVEKYHVETIFFAIPSCPAEDKQEILRICATTGCKVKTSPSMEQMLSGVGPTEMRTIELEDLLQRPPIRLSTDAISGYLQGKTVLVTGVGSIGSELCRQIARYRPGRLILFDIYENNAYDLQMELRRAHPDLPLTVLIGSVRDEDRIKSLFDTYRPQIVFHAAAHKHVPLMEDSPHEAVKNNVKGTLNVARAADKYGAERFLLISTDKAVNPTNVMGASKRLCEMIIQTFARTSKTSFVAVRFGNVLGSNGSVVPLFRKQIEMGGPVTITHPDIIRYFMTIPEAVSLILEAGGNAKGGEIFILDMGKPVRILDMAENLIRLSGLRPYEDIDIKFIGLRPGEKLFEELLLDAEGLEKTSNSLIYVAHPLDFDTADFFSRLDTLFALLDDERSDIRPALASIVPTYRAKEMV